MTAPTTPDNVRQTGGQRPTAPGEPYFYVVKSAATPLAKGVACVLAALVLTACARPMGAPEWAHLGPHPYRLGPARVFILAPADVETACRRFVPAGKVMTPFGCFTIADGVPMIVSIEDPYVLLHEIKHWIEPEWRHR